MHGHCFNEKPCTLDFKRWIQKLEASNQNLVGFLWIEMDSIEYLEFPFKNLAMDEILSNSTKILKVGKCAIVNYNHLGLV